MRYELVDLQGQDGRMFVVGDLHGAYEALLTALRQVRFDPHKDFLFSVGDLVDRGEGNLELIKLFDSEKHLYAVRGNHEEMIVEEEWDMHAANGGLWYLRLSILDQDYIDAVLKDLPIVMTVISPSGRKIGLVHADCTDHWDSFVEAIDNGDHHLQKYAQWGRTSITRAKQGKPMVPVEGVDMVYMGHTPNASPVRARNRVWLDTGAWFKNEVYLEQVL